MTFADLWKSNPWEGHTISLMTNNKTWVKFLKLKDQTFEAFKNFKITIENGTRRKIKALKFDNGKKYTSKKFNEFYNNDEMKKEINWVYSL